MTVRCFVDREVAYCLCFLLISGNGARLIVQVAVPFDGSGKDRLVVLSSGPKAMYAATILHSIVCNVWCTSLMRM